MMGWSLSFLRAPSRHWTWFFYETRTITMNSLILLKLALVMGPSLVLSGMFSLPSINCRIICFSPPTPIFLPTPLCPPLKTDLSFPHLRFYSPAGALRSTLTPWFLSLDFNSSFLNLRLLLTPETSMGKLFFVSFRIRMSFLNKLCACFFVSFWIRNLSFPQERFFPRPVVSFFF